MNSPNCPTVTGYLAIENGFMLTFFFRPSKSNRSFSSSGEPIRKVPPLIATIAGQFVQPLPPVAGAGSGVFAAGAGATGAGAGGVAEAISVVAAVRAPGLKLNAPVSDED